jgi:hypothetical protein
MPRGSSSRATSTVDGKTVDHQLRPIKDRENVGKNVGREEVRDLAAREGLCLVRSTNETGFMGVKKYQALFGDVYLGSFPTAEEAALCYARYLRPKRAAAEAAAAAADVATGSAAARAEVVAMGKSVALPLAHDEARGSGRARGRLSLLRWFVNMLRRHFDSEVRVTIPLQHVPWQHPPYLPPPFPLLACVNVCACKVV